MMRIAKGLSVAAATLGLSAMTAAPAGQLFQQTPCGIALPGTSSHGLTLVNDGTIVYNSNQGLCWLSDANLAGNPFVRALMNFSGANPDGSMDYATAVNWVAALNGFNNGKGWLNHNNWQLPTTQATDTSCSSAKGGNFGALCMGSALATSITKA